MNDFKSSSSLFSDSENFNNNGFHPLPIVGKEPLKGSGKWTDKKGTIADQMYLQKYFGDIQSVKRVAILLDSIKIGFAIDIDGAIALDIFQKKVVPRLSEGLQNKIDTTTHTRTANGGYHWLFEILRQDFPKGLTQGTYWTPIQNSHAEIKIIGSNQYLIERGDGYEPIRGIESLVALSQQEVNEFLSILDHFSKETQAIRKVGSKLVGTYRPPNRQSVALRASGYLYKHHGVPQQLTFDLIEYLIEATADDEPQMRHQAVRDTYSKDANTDQVSGYTKFLEAVNGDESVIQLIQKEYGRLGYHSSYNGSRDDRTACRFSNNAADNTTAKEKTKNRVYPKIFHIRSSNSRGYNHRREGFLCYRRFHRS